MSLKDSIESVKNDFLTEFASINDSTGSELIRQKYLGRNGLVTNLFKELGRASNDDRPVFGQLLNQLKNELSDKINSIQAEDRTASDNEVVDIALPGKLYPSFQFQACPDVPGSERAGNFIGSIGVESHSSFFFLPRPWFVLGLMLY